MSSRLIVVHFVGEIVSLAAAGVALFLSAGRIDWWTGWAVLAVWAAWFAGMDLFILRSNPRLLAERLAPPKGGKGWDRAILSVLRLSQLARYILGGLDQRYGWTGDFPVPAQWAALAVCLASGALFTWAMASNPFFSQVVRIQSEQGHAVATGGPYGFVRHPGYVAMILFELGMSVLLASWWTVAVGAGVAVLLIVRTALEDRTLQVELAGYGEYAGRVRYRLVPGVW